MIDAKQVELRVLEAAETIMILPADSIGGANAWPSYVREVQESYGYAAARYRRRVSPGAISRMFETWEWINGHPDESDRKILYAWAWHKVRFGDGVRLYAEKAGIKPRTLRWTITRICAAIAARLTQSDQSCLSSEVDDIAENLAQEPPDSGPDRPLRPPLHIMTADAKPKSLPDSPDRLALIERLTAAAERRKRKRRRSETGRI